MLTIAASALEDLTRVSVTSISEREGVIADDEAASSVDTVSPCARLISEWISGPCLQLVDVPKLVGLADDTVAGPMESSSIQVEQLEVFSEWAAQVFAFCLSTMQSRPRRSKLVMVMLKIQGARKPKRSYSKPPAGGPIICLYDRIEQRGVRCFIVRELTLALIPK